MVELMEVAGQNLARGALALVDDASDFLVDHLGGGVGDILALGHRVTEEDLFLVLAVTQRAELLAEAELGDHAAGQACGAAGMLRSAPRHPPQAPAPRPFDTGTLQR